MRTGKWLLDLPLGSHWYPVRRSFWVDIQKIIGGEALASVAQLVGVSSCNQRVTGSIPHQDKYIGCGFQSPIQVHMGGNLLMLLSRINVSLFPFLSLKKQWRRCPQLKKKYIIIIYIYKIKGKKLVSEYRSFFQGVLLWREWGEFSSARWETGPKRFFLRWEKEQ